MNPFRYLGMLWQHSRIQTLLLLVLVFAASITQGLGLLLLVPLLETFQSGGASDGAFVRRIVDSFEMLGLPNSFEGLLLSFLALNTARAVIVYGHTMMGDRLRLELLDQLRATSFDAVLGARWDWHVTRKKSDISNLLMNEIGRLGVAVTQALQLLVTGFSIAAYSLVALSLSFWLSLCALGFGLVLFAALSRQHSLSRQHGQALTEANRQVQQAVEEGLAGIKLIKILRIEDRHRLAMRSIRDTLRDRTIVWARLNERMKAIFQILVAFAMVALLYLGNVVFGLSLSILLVLVVLFARLAPLVQAVQRQVNALMHAEAALENLTSTLRQARSAYEGELGQPMGQPESQPIEHAFAFQRDISLTDVAYFYPEKVRPSLDSVSVTIPYGKTTAIMGASGSGKSTLADLMMGLLQPSSGQVTVDGTPIDGSNRLMWRQCIAYMPQDVFLFHDTIRKNLLWANEDASDAALTKALENAAAGFVFDLPQGVDTIVGDMGHRLSGGERQRIALARALLQKPRLLILDEATSALDEENEAAICKSLRSRAGELTVIMLGHRQSTVQFADQLVVMENGQIKRRETRS